MFKNSSNVTWDVEKNLDIKWSIVIQMAISKDASFLAGNDTDYAVSSNLISITPYTAKVSFATGFKMFSASQLASKHGFDCKRCGRREKHVHAKGSFILICCCDYSWLDRRIQLIPVERQSPCWETSSVGIQGNAVPYGFSPWIIYHFFPLCCRSILIHPSVLSLALQMVTCVLSMQLSMHWVWPGVCVMNWYGLCSGVQKKFFHSCIAVLVLVLLR